MKKEIWKDIEGYEGKYKISTMARVKSLPKKRYVHNSKNAYWTKEIILKPQLRSGYPSVGLYNNGQKHYVIHRLVAKAFIPNPKNKEQINHKNGIKTDNRVENLEWCTQKENASHALKNGLYNSSKGEDHYRSKLTKKEVIDIRKKYDLGLSQNEISKIYPVTKKAIGRIVNRETWKHI